VAIIQARMGSTRLPGKILRKLGDKSILEILIERTRKSKTIDSIVVATTTDKKDDIIVELSEKLGVKCYRGDEENALDRYLKAASLCKADVIVRITADNPLTDIDFIDSGVEYLIRDNYDFVVPKNIILGLGSGVFTFNTLEETWEHAEKYYQREHVTPYIYEHPETFKIKHVEPAIFLKRNDIRLTIDTMEDLTLYQELHNHFGDLANVDVKEIVMFLDKNPHVKEINVNVRQKHYKEGVK
jgi:spore coat polysaccharide biosynthesis protein SpsF